MGGLVPPSQTQPSNLPIVLITNFTATGRNLYTLFENGRNTRAWTELYHIPQHLVPMAIDAKRIAVTSDQYDTLHAELVKQ